MVAKRIIPCLDVKDGKVIKGTQFKNHRIVGDILTLAQYYSTDGADELVFYDITASCESRSVDVSWIKNIARNIDIPFCVAGGIRSLQQAENVLNAGADKISINSPALENPNLIDQLVKAFGQQCVVIGIDSIDKNNDYFVCQYTGNENKTLQLALRTLDWVNEVQQRGAGEIVLNCMNQDGMRNGYDINQLKMIRDICGIPLIASGGAGKKDDFSRVFSQSNVCGALAASVFHTKTIAIPELKQFLKTKNIEVRV